MELDEKKVDNGPLSKELIDIVRKLTEECPQKRLGIKGTDEVLNHPWFKGVDWDKLLKQEYELKEKPGSTLKEMREKYKDEAMTQDEQAKIYFKDWDGSDKKNNKNGVSEFFTHLKNWFFKEDSDKKKKKK